MVRFMRSMPIYPDQPQAPAAALQPDCGTAADALQPAEIETSAVVSATKQVGFLVDANHNHLADRGDTLRYTVTLRTLAGELQGTAFSDSIDAATALVPGSMSVSPYISATSPRPGTSGAGIRSTITITLSQSASLDDKAFTIECPSGSPIDFASTPELPATGTAFKLTPSIPLAASVACRVTVSAARVHGGVLNMASDYAFTFVAAAPSCNDGVKNGSETDVDCGGACPFCADQKTCLVGTDCLNRICNPASHTCTSATCNDGVKNGSESDIDCGGLTCPPCADSKTCLVGTDCRNRICSSVNHTCTSATCADGVKNGAETDVDCGGGACPYCALGKTCITNSDCSSQKCSGGVCQSVAAAGAMSGETVTHALGSVPAGQTVLIVFDVKLIEYPAAGATVVSNQGSFSGSNFMEVLTDDPGTPLALDATTFNVARRVYLPQVLRH
jgi:uncharacterized repeat protein (TIGR01451 family)